MQAIICSHGFGVKADSRGMFPELAAALPEYSFMTFDYNEVLPNGDTVVASLQDQAKLLQQEIDKAPVGSALLCHSQGCIIAGLVDLSRVGKVILLAPPVTMSMQRVIEILKQRPGSEVNTEAYSKLPRRDGTTTLLSPEYMKDIDAIDPMERYQRIADTKPTLIVRATEDETLGLTGIDQVKGAEHRDIAADHNFNDASRQKLADSLKDYL